MTGNARTLTYPPEGLGAPKDRHPGPLVDLGLPAGTEVFSADDHISLAEDIFYERFPDSMKDRAPRVMNVGGGWVIGMDGKSILVPEFIEVLTQYDPVSGSHTGDVDARLAALESEGVSKELAFPNSDSRPVRVAGQGGPRALLPDLQRAHRGGAGAVEQPHLRRRPDQLVGRGRRSPDGERAEGARVEDVPHAALAGQGPGEAPDRLRQHRDGRRLGGDRGGAGPGLAPHR